MRKTVGWWTGLEESAIDCAMNKNEIFLAAVASSDPEQHARFVEQACGKDAPLRAQIQRLLEADQRESGFLDRPMGTELKAQFDQFRNNSRLAETTLGPRAETMSVHRELEGLLQPSDDFGSKGRLAHYDVKEVIGEGAFGIVVRAFDEKLQRHVAIKLLRPSLAATDEPRQRFLREARSAARIRHDRILSVYAVEDVPVPFMVMELIEGITLQDHMAASGPLNVSQLLMITRQIAAGLAAAHAQGLVHRDIKPANILLREKTLDVVVSDFGLARAVDDVSLTASGVIAGTPLYMAPEQVAGKPVDQRTDLFSLGSVVYQMASGRSPFHADSTLAVLKRVSDETPADLRTVAPDVPESLSRIVTRLLEKHPENRYRSAEELLDELRRFESGDVSDNLAHATVPDRRSAGKVSRSQRPVTVLAGMILAIISLGFGVYSWQNKNHQLDGDRRASDSNRESDARSVVSDGGYRWSTNAPPPAIAPFNTEQAAGHQKAWAHHLGVPVEFTNSIGMKFRLIPPGEFYMGSSDEEQKLALAQLTQIKDRLDKQSFDYYQETLEASFRTESPRHQVIVTLPFFLSATEVTQGQYEQVTGKRPSYFGSKEQDLPESNASDKTDQYPVEQISWIDAIRFCIELSRKEQLQAPYFHGLDVVKSMSGDGYRLPNEAQWEFACRAGTTSMYWFGQTESDGKDSAWFNCGLPRPVAGVRSNPFGLFDMHGNVSEYVQDGFDPEFYTQFQQRASVDPEVPFGSDASRVVRGGTATDILPLTRSAIRGAISNNLRPIDIGMRVALPVSVLQK